MALTIASVTPGLAQSDRSPPSATTPTSVAPQSAAAQLDALFREYDAWRFHEFPELARDRGAPFDPSSVTEEGIVPRMRRDAQLRLFLDDLKAIDPTSLDARDRLDYDLVRSEFEDAIEGFELGGWLLLVDGQSGPQQTVPQSAERWRFETEADYASYLRRLAWIPGNVRAAIDVLTLGVERGRTPPKVVMERVPAQFDAVLHGGLDALAEPFRAFPASITAERRQEFLAEFNERLMPAIRAAMEDLANYVRTEYIPHCSDSIAASDQPDGARWYAHRLRVETTTNLTADEIHAIGLSEVQRISGEMLTVIRTTDWYAPHGAPNPDLAALADDALFARFSEYLRTSPRFYFTDAEALLAGYRDVCKRADALLPRFFGTLPRLTYGVRAVPSHMAPSQATAYYEPGSLPNGEPGWFVANTYALDQRPRYEMIPLALHEAVPGHHLQTSIAFELEGVREFRRLAEHAAYVEGWALYAERLGIEMGMYADPYDAFGRLLFEMWRACRLVVDTGMHAKGMSRDEAIAYLRTNTALADLNIRNEVDRYIAWPGQACAYKLGELTIRRLRSEAEAALGDRFSLRAFHDVVLRDGSLPLGALEKNVRRWIDSQRAPR